MTEAVLGVPHRVHHAIGRRDEERQLGIGLDIRQRDGRDGGRRLHRRHLGYRRAARRADRFVAHDRNGPSALSSRSTAGCLVGLLVLLDVLLVLVVLLDATRDAGTDHPDPGAGRDLDDHGALVLVLIDDRAEDAGRRHDLVADLGAALLGLLRGHPLLLRAHHQPQDDGHRQHRADSSGLPPLEDVWARIIEVPSGVERGEGAPTGARPHPTCGNAAATGAAGRGR